MGLFPLALFLGSARSLLRVGSKQIPNEEQAESKQRPSAVKPISNKHTRRMMARLATTLAL